jgi:hypothetical protein
MMNKIKTIPKIRHHLWGIRSPYRVEDANFASFVSNTGWEYIRECTADRRAIIKLDIRNYSQLEVRQEDTGKAVLIFNCSPESDTD